MSLSPPRPVIESAADLSVSAAAALPVAASPEWPVLLTVAACMAAAGVSGWIARRDSHARTPRSAGAFVLTAWSIGPPGAALATAAAALAVCPSGLVGPPDPRRSDRGAAIGAVAALEIAGWWIRPRPDSGPLAVLAVLALAWVVLAGVGVTLAILWTALRRGATRSERFARGRSPLVEAAVVPCALVLVSLAPPGGAALPFAAALLVILAGAAALSEASFAHGAARSARDDLDARLGELATLHAVGREIASSLDARRILGVIDREVRKILEAQRVAIALADGVHGGLIWEWRGPEDVETEGRAEPVAPGLETEAAAERRPVRSADDPGAAAVPLLIEDRVIGVLRIDVAPGRPLDDHAFSFLVTLAQSAAVALENARQHRLATVDSLTGLMLRDGFFARAEQEHARAERYDGRFAVLMLDLDGFKRINDEHGHAAGDRALAAVGTAVRQSLRTADVASRYGGDEICILLPETGGDGAWAIAERLRGAVSGLLVDAGGDELRITASIGLATYPDDGRGAIAAVLHRADQALYRAKRAGRNRVVAFSGPADGGPRRGQVLTC